MDEPEHNTIDVDVSQLSEAHGEVRPHRQPKPTEAYQDYQRQIAEKNFHASISSWRNQAMKLRTVLCDSRNIDDLRKSRDILSNYMEELNDINQNLNESLNHERYDKEIFPKFDQTQISHLQLIKEITERIHSLETDQTDNHSNYSVHSRSSKRSLGSGHSSQISKRVEAAAEAAMLKSKLKFIEIESRKKIELEKIQTLKELEIAEAKLNAITDIERENSYCSPVEKLPVCDKSDYVVEYLKGQTTTEFDNVESNLNVNASVFQPHVLSPTFTVLPDKSGNEQLCEKQQPSSNNGLSDVQLLAQAIASNASANRLPVPEPGIFTGDPLKYPSWKCAFGTLIEQKGIPPPEQIYYLKKYLGGPAKEAVEGYFFLTSDSAYSEARQLLEERYGDPFTIANAFRDKLEAWPKLQTRDSVGLRKLADFLRQCESAMNAMDCLSVLNDSRENRKVLDKLPEWLVLRWGRIVFDWKERYNSFPPFSQFVSFIVKESNIANDPIALSSAQKVKRTNESETKKRYHDQGKYMGVRTLSTKVKPVNNEFVSTICDFCDMKHHLDNCKAFQQKSVLERKAFVKEAGLCFGCFCKGHTSKFCRRRLTCSTCDKRHPTSLHGDSYYTTELHVALILTLKLQALTLV